MTKEPSPNGDIDRDAAGRFTKGNAGGPGNPHARRVGKLRSDLLNAVDGEAMKRVVKAMIHKAEAGDVAAARLLLEYTLGRPRAFDERDESRLAFAFAFRSLDGTALTVSTCGTMTPPL